MNKSVYLVVLRKFEVITFAKITKSSIDYCSNKLWWNIYIIFRIFMAIGQYKSELTRFQTLQLYP